MVRASSDNLYGQPSFIVDASAAKGSHTTIAAALSDAVSGQTIGIRPSSSAYNEDLTLKAGVNLFAMSGDELTPNVTIKGKCTATFAGTASFSGIRFETDADFALVVSGASATVLIFDECYFNCTDNTGISLTSSSSSSLIEINRSDCNLGTTGIAVFAHSGAGEISFNWSFIANTGGSVTASTASDSGIVRYRNSFINTSTTISSTARLQATFSTIAMTTDQIAITINGTSLVDNIRCCVLENTTAGTSEVLTIGAGALCKVTSSTLTANGTNAITGAGTLQFAGCAFSGAAKAISTTTINHFSFKGGIPWTLLQQGIASASATIDFVFDNNTEYLAYKILIYNLRPATDAVNLLMRTSTDGGSTYDAGASDYGWVNSNRDYTTTATSNGDGDNADTAIQLNDDGFPLGNAANEISEFEILINRAQTPRFISCIYTGVTTDAASVRYSQTGSGTRLASADVDAIRFLMSSGNITSGVFNLFGMVD